MTGPDTSFERSFDSLESLADALSEMVQSQLTIEDANHNVIAYSSHQYESDPARIATIVGRRVPDTVIAGLRKKGVMHLLETSSQAVRIPALMEVGLGPRLAICIKNQDMILGYIWVVDSGSLNEDHAEALLAKAAEAAKFYLLKQRSRKTKLEKTHDEFFWKLLTGYTSSESVIKQDAEKLSIVLPDSYYVIIFAFHKPLNAETLNKIRSMIASLSQVRLSFLSSDGNQAIGLFSLTSPHASKKLISAFIESFTRKIEENYELIVTLAGCSAAFKRYTSAVIAYKEVNAVLTIKRMLPYHTRNIWHYDDLGFLMHLPLIIEHKKTNDYPNPYVALLREHDQEHKSDFIRTISVYLSCNCNPKQSASMLHIHVNTLNYRLNRISEITGHHLKDMNYLLSLYLDLLIEENDLMNQILE
ncbi:PucR family transcriptional regulator [Paenibacillus mendelii]|uniref:PucR family transcriptional regulator n=1 Tax=Paenibacillus mendelii TaxID=206163 RepID=A0ABV6J9N9_9BACL|nr:helix-turn-helix domain-containing protein [Paenibacillus mendelii]MCQ6561040.1 helix-turn-helix domain-containing protein [Paenibacillus mendelii]